MTPHQKVLEFCSGLNLVPVDEYVRIQEEFWRETGYYHMTVDRVDKWRRNLQETAARKAAGARCAHCENPIWVIGTVDAGWDGCFTCITGEADGSNDYEVF